MPFSQAFSAVSHIPLPQLFATSLDLIHKRGSRMAFFVNGWRVPAGAKGDVSCLNVKLRVFSSLHFIDWVCMSGMANRTVNACMQATLSLYPSSLSSLPDRNLLLFPNVPLLPNPLSLHIPASSQAPQRENGAEETQWPGQQFGGLGKGMLKASYCACNHLHQQQNHFSFNTIRLWSGKWEINQLLLKDFSFHGMLVLVITLSEKNE